MQRLSKVIAPILTSIIFGVIACAMFVVFDKTNRIDSNFITTTLLGTTLTLLTTLIWHPQGVENGKSNIAYKNVVKQYNTRAEYIVSNQLIAKCKEFCELENEKFATKLIKDKLSKACLDLTIFESYKKKCDGVELDEDTVKRLQSLTRKQEKVLRKLRDSKPRFAPLRVEDLLRMKKFTKRIKPIHQERLYKTILYTSKVLWSICSFAILAFVTVSLDTTSVFAKLFQMAVWLLIVGFNIFTSLNSGNKSITVFRKNDLIELSTNCAKFFEWVGISLQEVEKDLILEEEPKKDRGKLTNDKTKTNS